MLPLSENALVPSIWNALRRLLVGRATYLVEKSYGVGRYCVPEEAEDFAQGFIAQKFNRPQWQNFIQQCSQKILSGCLPSSICSDFTCFVYQQLEKQRRTRPLSAFSKEYIFDKPVTAETWHELLQDLPSELKKIFEMMACGLDEDQMAERMRVCGRTVRNRKQELKKFLKEYGS